MKPRRTVLFASLFILYLFVEGLSFLCLILLAKVRHIKYDPNPSSLSESQKTALSNFLKRGKGERVGVDSTLGWVIAPSEANSAGMRDNQEYETVPRPGIVRISAFGDSFTYGADVPLADCWEKQMTAMSPSIEVLNYGVGGYGFDQAYLRYLQVGTDYHPNIVFIGFMSENIARDVNVFRGFYTNMYRDTIFTKPRFQVRDGQLVLLKNPLATMEDYKNFLDNDTEVLAELGKNDYHYRMNYNHGRFDFSPSVRLGKMFWAELNKNLFHPIFKLDGLYDVNSEAYQVTVRIFDAFYRKVLENGAVPVILVFPDLNDQFRSREGKIRRYTALLEYFRSKGYRFIDTLDALKPYESRYRIDQLSVMKWGHYTPLGNGIIAKYILTELKEWDFADPSKLHQVAQEERRRLAVEDH
jgi:hypothetical protein